MEKNLNANLKKQIFNIILNDSHSPLPPSSAAADKISEQFGKLKKMVNSPVVQKAITLLAENSFIEGYKLGLSINQSLYTRKDFPFERIIYRMRDKGLEDTEIAEYLGLTKEQVEKVLSKK